MRLDKRRSGAAALVVVLLGFAATPATVGPVAAQSRGADAAGFDAARILFTSGAVPPCGLCHTLADAGTTGAIGPILDEVRPDTARVTAALVNGIGAMPSYKATLKPAEIELLSRYVARVSGT